MYGAKGASAYSSTSLPRCNEAEVRCQPASPSCAVLHLVIRPRVSRTSYATALFLEERVLALALRVC